MMSEEIHCNTLAVKDMVTDDEESAKGLQEELQKAIESTQEHLRRLAADREPVSERKCLLCCRSQSVGGNSCYVAEVSRLVCPSIRPSVPYAVEI